MKIHRCRRGEEEKEEGVRNCEEMRLFIGREGPKTCLKTIITVKKRVKTRFYTWIPVKNVLLVVQTRPKLLVQSGLYNPDYTWIPNYIFRKHTIMAWTKGKLGTLCMVSVGSDLEFGFLQHWILLCGPHCTDNFCGPQRPDTCINRGPCFHYK